MLEAILLVGGFGTRMRPLTEHTPKPMLPVAGVPFVHHQIARARDAGVSHVVLATSYRAEAFREGLGDGSAIGVRVDYSLETVPLGTGGAIRHAADLLHGAADDPVLILNGDVLDGHDLTRQLAVHRERAADVTLYLTVVDDARAFGCVPTDGQGRVTAFLEKMPQPITNQINAGCYTFRRGVIDGIPSGRPVSVERETFPELLAHGCGVYGVVDTAYWIDLGTPAAYVRGSADAVLGRVASSAVRVPAGESLVHEEASVAADARLGGGASILAGAEIGAGSVIDASVVMAGATLGPGCVVRRSVVGRGAVVGADVVLEDAVVGDAAFVGDGNELRRGAWVACDAKLPPGCVRFS